METILDGSPPEAATPEEQPKAPHTFLESFRNQRIIIGRIIMHDIRVRFKRRPFGVVRLILRPCSHLFIWWVIMTYIKMRHERMGMAPILIISTGYVPFFFFRGPASLLRNAITSSRGLMRYPGVKRLDIIFARFITEAAAAIAASIIIFTLLITLKVAPFPRDILGLFPPLAVLLALGLGFGTFFAYISPFHYFIRGFGIGFTMRVFYFSGGIMYLGTAVIKPLARLMVWNPMFNCVELFRISYFHNFRNPFVNLWYPLCWAVVFFGLGLAMEVVVYSRYPQGIATKKRREEKFDAYDD